MSYEITLKSVIECKDKMLYGRLLQIEALAKPLLSYAQGKFPYYTPHDFYHSSNVEENLNWLIPDKLKESFNNIEIFFLIIAAWLHDWGMVGQQDEDPEKIRATHHIRTEQFLEKLHDQIGLTIHEAMIVGKICKGHRKTNLYDSRFDDLIFSTNRIKVRLLAALLRLADETDITHSRTPEIIYYSLNPEGASDVEFQKHLAITGIGQFDEPHKIYISAVARDPKGAQTLREVAAKIQKELDTVKGIISQYGLSLDIVELKMETRGFIDKPISFQVNKSKIVDLLIGKHLYKSPDAAIRELIQNSIDSCMIRKLNDSDYIPEILLTHEGDGYLIIEDNGIGMGFSEAKEFLSCVGSSFYSSDEFKKTLKDKPYDPISHFGIGVLSCFLIANSLVIETLKYDDEPCKFSIPSMEEGWRYERGSLENPGTRIILSLNPLGMALRLDEAIKKHFISPDFPIRYKEKGMSSQMLLPNWKIEAIMRGFFFEEKFQENTTITNVLQIEKPEYSLFLIKVSDYISTKIILFNHGIHVKNIEFNGLGYRYCLLLNVKTNLFDLHISRENVIENSRWFTCLYKIFNDILDYLFEKHNGDEPYNYIVLLSSLIENRFSITKTDVGNILDKNPIIKSFFDHALFPSIINKKPNFLKLSDIVKMDNFKLYICCSSDIKEEFEFISKNIDNDENIIFQPFDLPYVKYVDSNDKDKYSDILKYILMHHKIKYSLVDLRDILLNKKKILEDQPSDILPNNILFATFENFHPLIVTLHPPQINEEPTSLGSSYWGNIALWNKLMAPDRRRIYLELFREIEDSRYETINLLSEPVTLIDSSDEFISKIIENKNKLKPEQKKFLKRYFLYLSYLPLVLHDLASRMIFIEVLETLEIEIAQIISIEKPPVLLSRMKPNGKLYLQFLLQFGLDYVYVQDQVAEAN